MSLEILLGQDIGNMLSDRHGFFLSMHRTVDVCIHSPGVFPTLNACFSKAA